MPSSSTGAPRQIARDPAQRAREFTDDAICTAEQTRFGRDCWTLLGLARDLIHENDWITGDIGGRVVFVQRFRDGLAGFENICAHRFFPLRSGERGNSPLRCGFHGWAYGRDGLPLGIPMGDTLFVERERVGRHLNPIDIEICGGLVFGRLSCETPRPSLAAYLGDLAAPLALLTGGAEPPLAVIDQTIAANWKHAYELTLDDYHVATVHPGSFGADGYLKPGTYRYCAYGNHSAMTVHLDGVTEGDFDAWIAGCHAGEIGLSAYRILQIFPNIVAVLLPYDGGWVVVVSRYAPVDAGHTQARTWILPCPVPGTTNQAAVDVLRQIFDEDRAIAEKLQSTAGQVMTAPLLGRQEERIAWFDEAYAAFMSGAR